MHYDLAILGGGCAGLALTRAVCCHSPEKRIAVIEQKTEYTNDRTWCGWHLDQCIDTSIIRHSWLKSVIQTHKERVVFQHGEASYQMIRADDYYAYMFRACQSPNVHWYLGQTAECDETSIFCPKGSIQASQIIDTRPRQHYPTGTVLQHFLGQVIRFSAFTFARDTMVLMDFRVPQDKGLCFIYILPLSDHSALIELTFFSEQRLRKSDYRQRLHTYCQRYVGEIIDIEREEYGVIPMTTQLHTDKVACMQFGLAAGFARPATGYTFATIQYAAHKLAAELALPRNKRVIHPVFAPWLFWADSLFIKLIRFEPQAAQRAIVCLFQDTDPDILVRFMTNTHSVDDMYHIIKVLPKWPFLRMLFHRR